MLDRRKRERDELPVPESLPPTNERSSANDWGLLDRILPWRDRGVTPQEAHAPTNWVPMQPLSGWGGQQPFRVPRGHVPSDFDGKQFEPDS